MAIFLVEVTFTVPVEAESQRAAEEDTESSWARDELHTNGLSGDASVYATRLTAAGRWGGSLPWGGDGERTISQILAAEGALAPACPEGEVK